MVNHQNPQPLKLQMCTCQLCYGLLLPKLEQVAILLIGPHPSRSQLWNLIHCQIWTSNIFSPRILAQNCYIVWVVGPHKMELIHRSRWNVQGTTWLGVTWCLGESRKTVRAFESYGCISIYNYSTFTLKHVLAVKREPSYLLSFVRGRRGLFMD